ncbi:MAG: type II toxin-antitoxin system PemK/MazF family toxin [Bacteroidales bacterium]|nr:type II toxin-antitoxin system PemK/MazF family toxin [Bacteroidales bacterium]
MNFRQRDIVLLDFQLPKQDVEEHPWIIISNNDIHENEDYFIAVMMSSKKQDDYFSFWIEDEMLTVPPKKKSQIRCNIINLFDKVELKGKAISRIKEISFDKLIDHIFNFTFSTD